MRAYKWIAVLLLMLARIACGTGPVLEGVEGKQAFDDLGELYQDHAGPNLPQLWSRLHAPDPATRASAGRYLLAICRQSFADEATGRTSLSKYPPAFGHGPDVIAREFRQQIARDLKDHAATPEAVPALEWLLQNDFLPQTRTQALDALCQINAPEADKVLVALISQPHPQGAIVVRALQEAENRNLREAANYLPALAVHFRGDVRNAAQTLAEGWGLGNLPEFNPIAAVAHFDHVLRDIAQMVYPSIPPNAQFLKFTENFPASDASLAHEYTGWAWLIHEDTDTYHVIDSFGGEQNLTKAQTTITPATLAQWGQSLLELRAAEGRDRKSEDAIMALSPGGTLGGQFEPEAIRLPEIMVAAWSYVRGDRATAAAVLLPRMEALADERWLREIARDLLGHQYDEAMLTEFVDARDYPAALAYAAHLCSPLFDNFEYQDRARKLLQELPARMTVDFVTLTLPSPDTWQHMRRQMTRTEQIHFLADRLQLVNVRQPGWPADMQFCDPQRSLPMGGTIYARVDYSRGEPRINPMRELTLLRLEPADLPALLPSLTREEYVLAYHAWRPWSPTWHVFQVNELVADLANEAAGTRFVDLQNYYDQAPADRAAYLAELQQRSTTIPPRWLRAARDLKTVSTHPITLTVGTAILMVSAVWLWLRRKAPTAAILGPSVLVMAALIIAWSPALQAQRAMLGADRLPAAITVAAALLWSSRLMPRQKTFIASGLGFALAVAWLGDVFRFWGWPTDMPSVAIAVLLAWVAITTKGWRNRTLAATALFFVLLAFAAPGILVTYVQSRGWTPPPDFETRTGWLPPLLTGLIAAGCLALLHIRWKLPRPPYLIAPPN